MKNETLQKILKNIVLLAFGYEDDEEIYDEINGKIHDLNNIERVYPITPPKSKALVMELINKWLSIPVRNIFADNDAIAEQMNIENMFEKAHAEMNSKDDDEDNEGTDTNVTNDSEGNSGFISVNEVTTVKRRQNYNYKTTIKRTLLLIL